MARSVPDLKYAFLALDIQYFTERQVLDVCRMAAETDASLYDEISFCDLISLNDKEPSELCRVRELLASLIAVLFPEFDLSDASSEVMARELFTRRLESYRDEGCTPWELCRMVQPIEQRFEFPEWLGDMYGACDWIEPNHQAADCRHLAGCATETLQQLKAPKPDT